MKTEKYAPARSFMQVIAEIYNSNKKTKVKFVCPRCKTVTHDAVVFVAMAKSFKDFAVSQKTTKEDGSVELICRHI